MARILAVTALLLALTTSGVACSGALSTVGLITSGDNAPVARWSTVQEKQIAADLMTRVNEERALRGLNPLLWDTQLAQRAARWSEEMSTTGLHHSDLHPLLTRFVGAAENIGTGPPGTSAGALHLAWMRSDSHRHDLLAPNIDRIGVGVACRPDGTMWATQEFGSTQSGEFGPQPATEPIARPDAGELTCRAF
jgi:uncharacterized protein YkwD